MHRICGFICILIYLFTDSSEGSLIYESDLATLSEKEEVGLFSLCLQVDTDIGGIQQLYQGMSVYTGR